MQDKPHESRTTSAEHDVPVPPDHRLPAESVTPPPKRRHPWDLGGRSPLIRFALLFYVVIRHGSGTPAVPAGGRHAMTGAVPVTTATAKLGIISVYLEAIGTVTPVYTASITAQVTGVITAVHHREGQTVHKGDPLIDLDARPYEAQLVQAEGALLQRRPDVAAAERTLAEAHAVIGIGYGAFFPNATLSASGGFESSTFTRWFNWPSRFWSIGPAISQTVFNGGLYRAELHQYTAVYNADVANYRQTVVTAFQQAYGIGCRRRSVPGLYNGFEAGFSGQAAKENNQS